MYPLLPRGDTLGGMDEHPDQDGLPPAPEGFQWDELAVCGSGANRRADVWLASFFPHYTRSAIKRHFASGRIVGVDRTVKAGTLLREGEVLRFCRPVLHSDEPPPPLPPVIYEDDRMIAFNKPAGMLVHPAGGRFVWSLIALARLARPGVHLHLVHRLDRDTSGVVVLAKDPDANRHLKEAFQLQATDKVYWAVCRGVPPWSTLLVDAPIGDDTSSEIRIRMGVRDDGLAARTRLFTLARWAGRALVAAHPRTGRTHQIRLHLEHVGFPILGDRLYGQPPEVFIHTLEHGMDAWALARLGWPRHALHARILRIPHPDGRPLELRAALPPDMAVMLLTPSPAAPGCSGAGEGS
jgi:23S rRNA pseudouridine1911/1915/1917 synthase